MKKNNIIAFVLGIAAALLLWYFYLGPKYAIRTGDESVMKALYEADVKALEEATNEVPGQLLFRTDHVIPITEDEGPSGPKEDVLSTRSEDLAAFEFSSQANRPRTLYEIAAAGDNLRTTELITISDDKMMVRPKIESAVPDTYEVGDSTQLDAEGTDPDASKSRVTMIVVPAKYHLLKDSASYNKFKKDYNGQADFPAVDFKKQMIVFLESEGKLSSSLFEIKDIKDGDKLTLDYRVNIIGSSERADKMPYRIIAKANKEIVLNQVK